MSTIIFEKTDNSFFLVPSELVDRYLESASELQLKVILLLLKNGGRLFTDSELAERFGCTEKEINDAIEFWSANKLLTKRKGHYYINFAFGESKPDYTADEIALKVNNDVSLRDLIAKTEKLYGKLLSPSELKSVVTLYEWEGIDAEAIYLIINYCFENDHKGFKYIEKTAAAWFEEGWTTADKVKRRIEESNNRKTAEYSVAKTVGATGRALTERETELFAVWVCEYGFSLEMIKKAYDISVEKTGKYTLGYMNTALKSWHEKGYKTPEDTEKEAKKKMPAKSNTDYGKYAEYSWEIIKNETD